MKTIVIYFSKNENTKQIAEYVYEILKTEALPLNLISKVGRSTKEEIERLTLLANWKLIV